MSWNCCSSASRPALLGLLALLLAAAPVAADPPAGHVEGPFLRQVVGAYDLVDRPTSSEAQRDTVRLPSPRGAVLRSLAVPGWGQIYNRQPLKVPFIVVGLGTLVGVSVHSNNRAILFRRAAIYHDCSEQPEQVAPEVCIGFEQFAPEFERADALTAGPLTGSAARSLRDQFRRQRDLFALLSFLAYGIQALDAYVAAELADFDVGEDLAIGLAPGPAGPGLSVRWRF